MSKPKRETLTNAGIRKQFPGVLYIGREDDNDSHYFVPEEQFDGHPHGAVIGVYRLEKVVRVETKTDLVDLP